MAIRSAVAKSERQSDEIAIREAALRRKRKRVTARLRRINESGGRQSCRSRRDQPGEAQLRLSRVRERRSVRIVRTRLGRSRSAEGQGADRAEDRAEAAERGRFRHTREGASHKWRRERGDCRFESRNRARSEIGQRLLPARSWQTRQA